LFKAKKFGLNIKNFSLFLRPEILCRCYTNNGVMPKQNLFADKNKMN